MPEEPQQRVRIVLLMALHFVRAVRLGKPKYRGLVSNVRRVKHPLDWKPRAVVVPPVSTKIKTAQEQDMVVKVALPALTEIKMAKLLRPRAKIALLDVGLPLRLLVLVPIVSRVLLAMKVDTMPRRDKTVPLPVLNVRPEPIAMSKA